MAQHDYVIDNSTGANVRADINNALQAIVTINSGSSAPSATFPFMLFADSSAGTMKIRNAADNAFIELFQLDGTFTLEDGSATTPALAFRDDLNTGIFQPGNNQLAVSCNGTEVVEFGTAEAVFNDTGADIDFRIEGDTVTHLFYVDAGNDRVGINTNTPLGILGVNGTGTSGSTASAGYDEFVIEGGNVDIGMCFLSPAANNKTQTIAFGDSNNNKSGRIRYEHANDNFIFDTGGNERVRIDSSGRLLIGTSSARSSGGSVNAHLQLEGTTSQSAEFLITRNTADSFSPTLGLVKTRGTSVGSNTAVQDNDVLGQIQFRGADGSDIFAVGASIFARVNGTPSDGTDMPAELVFATSADGSHSPSERMTINSSGRVGIATSSPNSFAIATIRDANGLSLTGDTQTRLVFTHENGGTDLKNFDIQLDSGSLKFRKIGDNNTTVTERMRLTSSTQLLIGVTSASTGVQYLETNQPQANDHCCAMFQSSTSSSLSGTHALRIQGHAFNSAFQGAHGIKFVNLDDQDRDYQAVLFKKNDGSTNVGSISYNQNSTSFNTSSDYRLKENAVAISDGITRLKTLKPYRFNFKDNPSKTVDGFFAHECTAVPEAITGEKDAMKAKTWYQEGDIIPSGKTVGMPKTYSSTEMEIQSLDQSKLVPLLVAAVQELIGKVEALEAA